jgi:SulP family sulfate permease
LLQNVTKSGTATGTSAFGGTWENDLISGAVVALVSLVYSLSFALLIFQGPLAAGLSHGIAAALISAGICTIIMSLGSSFSRAVGGPDSAPMAIMSGLAASVAASVTAPAALIPTVMASLLVAAATTGIFLLVLGLLRLEAWMRYIPYPVLAGFVAAVGLQLAAGGIFVLTGHRPDEVNAMTETTTIIHVAAGLCFAGAAAATRFLSRSHLGLPITIVVASIVIFAALLALDISPDEARAQLWLLTPPESRGPYLPWLMPENIDWFAVASGGSEIAAGAAIVAISVMLNGTSLELWSRRGLDLNTELRVNGLANLASGIAGGLPGNLSFNRTILNTRAGAMGRRAGMISGVILLALAVIGPGVAGVIPTPVLGGLLIYLGLSVLVDTFARARHTLGPADYAFLVMLVALILYRGYFEGVALGIIASCILFVVRYSRVETVRHDVTRESFGSTVDRTREENECLRTAGSGMHILWLRGFLFFGTANSLYAALERRMLHGSKERVRHFVLDFSRVSGIDSSAVFSFAKLAHLARDNGATLAFCTLSPTAVAAFRAEGLLHSSDRFVRGFPSLDQGLEWSEDKLLQASGLAPGTRQSPIADWLAEELGSAEYATRLLAIAGSVDIPKDGDLFSQDDPADALYFIESGRVAVVMTAADGARIRLRSMARHTVLGEMGLYRDLRRTATVVALEPTRVRRLAKQQFLDLKLSDPDLCDAVHRMVVRTLADRLAFANASVAALQ